MSETRVYGEGTAAETADRWPLNLVKQQTSDGVNQSVEPSGSAPLSERERETGKESTHYRLF